MQNTNSIDSWVAISVDITYNSYFNCTIIRTT